MQEHHSDKPHSKRKTRPWGYLAVALIAAVTSVLIYAGVQYYHQLTANPSGVLDNPASAEMKNPLGPQGDILRGTSQSFRMVAKKVGPAVVNIKATRNPKGARSRSFRRGGPRQPQPPNDEEPFPRDPFFDFFERFGQPFPMPQQESPQTSLGSGVLMDKKGIIVTNNHVVDGATDILVNLPGEKTEVKAKVIGTDSKTDLAVLRLDVGKEFPAVEWADSNTVEVGDWAIAIGSPFALGQSVTVGIVSAKGGRNSSLTGVEYGGDLIQTDAAINPGNSGGPLCDLEGKVIGINTAIYTRSGGYMGIGFAIPSNLAREVVAKLVTDGKIVRGWLGVYIEPLAPELARELGIKDGVGIREVIEDSPASNAGLKPGDVVTEVEGKPVKEVTELQRQISNYKPGENVKIKVFSYSDKKARTANVKIGKLPDSDEATAPKEQRPDEPDKLGLLVSPRGKEGVVVEAVQPGSAGEMAGLEPGDLIVRINRQPIDSTSAYEKAVGNAKRLFLEVKRKGRTLFIQLMLPE